MKNVIIIPLIVCICILSNCKKEDSSNTLKPNTPFEYISLVAQDTNIALNSFTTITANAKGDNLKYAWSYSFGDIIGNGASVQWTVCHKDKFTVTCEVSDSHGNSASKTIKMYSH